MSEATITYNDTTIASVDAGKSVVLTTKDKYLIDDITIEAAGTTPTGTKQISITQNGTVTEDVSSYANAEITVNVSGGESTSTGVSDVNFYDYDGSVVASYTASEFAALTAMPANPSHTGLTAQGWNWNLADAKSYVTSYGKLDIGQMYVTDDGKTRIYIHLEEGRLSPMLGVCPKGTVTVDWGDNTTPDTITGTSVLTVKWTGKHVYATPGDYVITLTVSGTMDLGGDNGSNKGSCLLRYSSSASAINYTYAAAIRRVEIGSNIATFRNNAFDGCVNLTSIAIASSITGFGARVFKDCYNLIFITIPSGAIYLGDSEQGIFSNCYNIRTIALPLSVSTLGPSSFSNCNSLTSITLPSNLYYNIYNNLFEGCYALSSIVIPHGSIYTIGNYAFRYCRALTSITIPSTVTNVGSHAFDSCYNMTFIALPSSVTSIGEYAFYSCYSLIAVTIPDSITTIENFTFFSCVRLTSITIPSGVTDIKNWAFASCRSLGFIKFKGSTPPTVSNNNAWNNLPTDCKIYVPAGSLAAYTSATNYPSSSTYTYVEY